MPSIAVYFLPVALFAILHAVAPAEESSRLSGTSSRHGTLGLLLRKRSLEAALRAPPSIYSESLIESPAKRDDGYWIWMPAHGYMPIPTDDAPEQQGGRDSMGNLLRYG
ncbi:unnamed protein product [Candidula unifasciata]|uniref:Uncharacterized protein n=1 Tax=Candidula unifasciata TaxID=100452 RepID=A0A8S3Z5N7_9EUPU|nr:unnamed protein product [Candidula unifasciata]